MQVESTDTGDDATTPEGPALEWSDKDRDFWMAAASDVGADKRQARFAFGVSTGMSKAAAARWSGYEGDANQAGYRASKTNIVKSLLAIGESHGRKSPDEPVSDAEAERLLSQLARSKDPNARVRALEALEKRRERRQQEGHYPTDDGFMMWRLARDLMRMKNGGTAFVLLHNGFGGLGGMPFLKQLARSVQNDWPEVWQRLVDQESDASKRSLEKALATPEYQEPTCTNLWAELDEDKRPEGIGQVNGAAGSA